MATITYRAGINDITINNLANSGLGGYGSAFGNSVAVGEFNQTMYITDANGTNQGPQVNNVKYLNPSSGYVNSSTSGVALLNIPNYLSTLNIRFTHSTAIKTQNAKCYFYDRSSINNDPSGVTIKAAEIIHPALLQTATGSGDSTWITPHGSSVVLDLVSSPGQSGTSINGTQTTQDVHDWYIACCFSPDSIGSKNFALWTQLEYL